MTTIFVLLEQVFRLAKTSSPGGPDGSPVPELAEMVGGNSIGATGCLLPIGAGRSVPNVGQ